MNQKLNTIQSLNTRAGTIAQARRELKNESAFIREEKRGMSQSFIREALDKFLSVMRGEHWQQDRYINGSYSDEFTRHVSRSNRSWYGAARTDGLSDNHTQALINYRAAFIKLNTAFLEAIQTEEGKEKLLSRACLKNISK